MTLADQAAMTGQDGRVTEQQPGRPKRRTFTKAGLREDARAFRTRIWSCALLIVVPPAAGAGRGVLHIQSAVRGD
jgi:hypothetical protein